MNRLLPLIALLLSLLALPADAALMPDVATGDAGPPPALKPEHEELPPPLMSDIGSAYRYWLVGMSIVGVLAIVFLWPRKKKSLKMLPPYKRARRDLEGLKSTQSARGIWRALRRYVLVGFNLPTKGSTAQELVAEFTRHPAWQQKIGEDFAALLAECEVAKYSRDGRGAPDLVDRALVILNALEACRATVGSSDKTGDEN